LRKQFQDGGLREQERKIAYALKRREAELSCARGTSRRLPGDKGPRAILWSSDSVLANFASFTLNKNEPILNNTARLFNRTDHAQRADNFVYESFLVWLSSPLTFCKRSSRSRRN